MNRYPENTWNIPDNVNSRVRQGLEIILLWDLVKHAETPEAALAAIGTS